jgi:hypothetical protein
MRRKHFLLGTVALGGALLGSASTAGGILCMLSGRDVSVGTLASAPKAGRCQVDGMDGVRELRLGPNTQVIRIERIPADAVQPGEHFVARNGSQGGPSPAVVVYHNDADLFALYNAVGHGTKKKQAAR